jgi:hypothetical protein
MDWDSTGVGQNKGLHVGLIDKSSLELNLFLINSNHRLSSQALDREDGWVGVILNENDNLVAVWNSFLREGIHVKVLGLVNCKSHLFRLHDEGTLVRQDTFVRPKSLLCR